LDLEFSAEQAEELARQAAVPPEQFEWFEVEKAANKAGNDSPAVINPIHVE
jgi:hypothetical protein